MGEQYLDLEKLGVQVTNSTSPISCISFFKKIFPSQIFKLEEYKVALDMLKEGSISKAMFNVSTS